MSLGRSWHPPAALILLVCVVDRCGREKQLLCKYLATVKLDASQQTSQSPLRVFFLPCLWFDARIVPLYASQAMHAVDDRKVEAMRYHMPLVIAQTLKRSMYFWRVAISEQDPVYFSFVVLFHCKTCHHQPPTPPAKTTSIIAFVLRCVTNGILKTWLKDQLDDENMDHEMVRI